MNDKVSMIQLKSRHDKSINWFFESGAEVRFVQRSPDYIVVYLSSHFGCDQACRMCHLTQTRQTNLTPQNPGALVKQASVAIDHYLTAHRDSGLPSADLVHFNFMARGEPMLSPVFQDPRLYSFMAARLDTVAAQANIDNIQINVSTIMPKDMGRIPFGPFMPRIYYSLYSTDPKFRKRWVPRAMPVEDAISKLQGWQELHGRRSPEVVLHWALIKGENDSVEEAERIGQLVKEYGLRARFSVVRYNPFSPDQGVEADEAQIQAYFDTLVPYMTEPGSKIVPRVGFDVKASCGMFLDPSADNLKEMTSEP